jgi:hypothetical protein
MNNEKKKQTIKFCIAVSIFVIILLIVGSLIVKYQVEGEKNLPFRLSKIIMISTAEGVEKEESDEQSWNLSIYQNNDVYLYIDKDENVNNGEMLTKVLIDNIQITSQPQKGTVRPYMPNSSEGRLYDYSDNYLVNTELEYTGASKSDPKTLEIGSQGGTAYIRFSNTQIGDYISKDDTEIVHNGTLLSKINVKEDEIKFSVSFDLTIETDKNKYKTTLNLDMPTNNLIEEGTTEFEQTDFSDLIFKRVN